MNCDPLRSDTLAILFVRVVSSGHFRHIMRAQEFNVHAIPLKRVTAEPPVRVHSIEDRGMKRVGAGNRHEFSIVRVKVDEVWVNRKLSEPPPTCRVSRDAHMLAASWIPQVGKDPFEEGVAGTGLTGGRKPAFVLVQDEVTSIKNNLAILGNLP